MVVFGDELGVGARPINFNFHSQSTKSLQTHINLDHKTHLLTHTPSHRKLLGVPPPLHLTPRHPLPSQLPIIGCMITILSKHAAKECYSRQRAREVKKRSVYSALAEVALQEERFCLADARGAPLHF